MRLPAVEYSENRGGDDKHPFGFVYFKDGNRLGYSPGLERELWGTNWGPVTRQHYEAAAAHIEQQWGVKVTRW